MRDLSVLFDENSVFTNFTDEAKEYLRDNIDISWVAAEDALYIGLYKPFYDLYLETDGATDNTDPMNPVIIDAGLMVEYYNGSIFTPFEVQDETKGFSRSGFIKWERELEQWSTTSVDSVEKYWIKLSFSQDFDITISGLNIVFANDLDLTNMQRDIDRFKDKNDKSFIAYHVSARDEIVQRLRNSGNVTSLEDSKYWNTLTKWDLLDIGEVRESAKYLALARINFDVSNQVDDKYYQRFTDYMEMFGSAFKLYRTRLDRNDNGIEEVKENRKIRTIEIVKS